MTRNTIRIGHGYDIHRFENEATKSYIMLGGVKIPYIHGLEAHSDGDVVIHAVCDALLGACALGDIGRHFPDTDPQYKNADSRLLLKSVFEKITALGYGINNIDVSILAQAPKLLPYHAQMKKNMSADLDIPEDHINIKATTNEGLDAVGNKLAIAVHAVVLVEQSK